MIKLEQVSFQYEGAVDFAVKNVSLSVERKEWIAILGQNGSGKSTLGRLFNGLLVPTEGTVEIDGLSTSEEDSVWEIRKRVGMVFQNPDHQFVATTVRDDIAFGLENAGLERDEMLCRIDTYSSQVGVNLLLDKEPHRLSGGQKQRVAIAGVISLEPDYIVFDEATSMLDPVGRRDVHSSMKMLHQRGMSIISITHDMQEAVLADRVIVMEKGEIVADGTPSQIFRSVDWIQDIGLAVPFSLEVQRELEKHNIMLDHLCLRDEELIDELWISSSKK